jgi:hypothetical protein
VPSFALWTALRHQGATQWADYAGTATAGNGHSGPVLPAVTALDVAAEKWFWQRRLRTHLALRNVFDDSARYHPIGAVLGLSALLQIEVVLPHEGEAQ